MEHAAERPKKVKARGIKFLLPRAFLSPRLELDLLGDDDDLRARVAGVILPALLLQAPDDADSTALAR